MKGYPIITREQFYKTYDESKYKYTNVAYRESDDSVLLYKEELQGDRELIFQLVSHLQSTVPEYRKNLYVLSKEDHLRLREEIGNNKTKKISSQLLSKFSDPYTNIEDKIYNRFIEIFPNIESLDIIGISSNLKFCPIITKSFEYLVESKKNSEREILNLGLAKEMIEKRISYLKTNKK